MRDLKVGTRLAVGFAIVIAIAFAFGAFAYIKAANPDETADQIEKVTMPAVFLSEDFRSNVQKEYALFQQLLSTTDQADLDRLETAITSERSQNIDIVAKLEGLSSDGKLQRSINSVKSVQEAYLNSLAGAINVSRPETEEAKKEALQMDSEIVWPAYANYLVQADALVAISRSAAEEQHPNPDASRILIFLAVAILFCFVISSLVIRSITTPLIGALKVLDHVAEGDLTYRAVVTSNDELGQLISGVNQHLENQLNAAEIAGRLAEGDLSIQVNVLSDNDLMGRALLRMRNNLLASIEIAERISDGSLIAQPRVASDKDKLGATLVRLRDRVKGSFELAEEISQGNLAVQIEPLSETDTLGLSLVRMRGNLLASTELATKLAEGDLSADTNAISDKDVLGQSLRHLQSLLRVTAQAVNQISEGDLSVKIKPLSANDALGNALIQMTERFHRAISEVMETASNVGGVSGQVIYSAEQLFHASNEHSAAAAETRSVINGITISLQQSASNSQETEKLASVAAEEGRLGGEAVSHTAAAMKEVAERINLLDEIARRTDMFTLAAAVEAARAGEHGAGFGVIASELRKLVERGQAAASDIIRLTSGGVKNAECAGEFLARMVPDVRKAAELVREIASASEEQNSDAARASAAIQQLDKVIHQNVSASQQMAATAEDLVSRTKILQAAVSFFKLEETSATDDSLATLASEVLQKGAWS